jgi:hypothetical protein
MLPRDIGTVNDTYLKFKCDAYQDLTRLASKKYPDSLVPICPEYEFEVKFISVWLKLRP